MKRRRWVVLAIVAAMGIGLVPPAATAQPRLAQQGETEIGVTAEAIRIAVIADVDNPIRPGLFQNVVNGMRAFTKYTNGHGKLAGRTVQLDFIDSKLNADESRNAVIKACREDFAIVGTTAYFLNDVEPLQQCVDKVGRITGLPDVPVIPAEVDHQCSPISFAIIVLGPDCATRDQQSQTYPARVGQVLYFKKQHKDLHGVFVIPGDLKSTVNSSIPFAMGEVQAGIELDEDLIRMSGFATQSDYTPIAQAIKQHGSTYAESLLDYKGVLFLRRESRVQNVTSVKVWGCALMCYDQRFLDEGRADVDGQYAALWFVPFEEAKQNKSVSAFLKAIGGKEKADGFAAQAWTAGLFFRDVVNRVVGAHGTNGLTRARFIENAREIHDFRAEVDGEGMLGATDVGGHRLNGCFVLMQAKGGKYVRVFPKQKGTLDCDKKNVVEVKLDLT